MYLFLMKIKTCYWIQAKKKSKFITIRLFILIYHLYLQRYRSFDAKILLHSTIFSYNLFIKKIILQFKVKYNFLYALTLIKHKKNSVLY
jgi:hypothetical protein